MDYSESEYLRVTMRMILSQIKPLSPLILQSRSLSNLSHRTGPHIAVVGAGPAGYYATQHIAKALPNSTIDMFEKLPVPYGLVRFGVAPDHYEVKNCITTFAKTANNENVNFFGNIALGRDISIENLTSNYHSVLLTYGTEEDRMLGVEGEELENVVPARDLVSLYNGLPGYDNLTVNLDTETVLIVGVGNVSLDVARMILTPVDKLKQTDVTESWLEQLAKSRVKRVVLAGRRGPLDVSFTIKELRELVKLEGARPVFYKQDYDGIKDLLNNLARPKKRLTELLVKTALEVPDKKTEKRWSEADREWHLKLFRSPQRFLGGPDGKSVTSAVLGVNISDGEGGVVNTGNEETLDCGLVVRSVGFKSVVADPALPWDDKRCVVPNTDGRVVGKKGLYVAGWVGTGPRGVIVDTMNTAFRVGAALVEDLKNASIDERQGSKGLEKFLAKSTNWEDWLKIEEEERKKGAQVGKTREKVVKLEDMFDIIGR